MLWWTGMSSQDGGFLVPSVDVWDPTWFHREMSAVELGPKRAPKYLELPHANILLVLLDIFPNLISVATLYPIP